MEKRTKRKGRKQVRNFVFLIRIASYLHMRIYRPTANKIVISKSCRNVLTNGKWLGMFPQQQTSVIQHIPSASSTSSTSDRFGNPPFSLCYLHPHFCCCGSFLYYLHPTIGFSSSRDSFFLLLLRPCATQQVDPQLSFLHRCLLPSRRHCSFLRLLLLLQHVTIVDVSTLPSLSFRFHCCFV